MFSRAGVAVIALAHMTTIACSQELPEGASAVPVAAHYRVDEGVFALRPGMSVDLTDRKILFTMKTDWAYSNREPHRFYIVINGERDTVEAGSRIDLKRNRSTAASVQDTASCFLDVLSFVAPKGAPPTATFRISCI